MPLSLAMHRNVEILIGRLVTDPDLRRRFAGHPRAALRAQFLELTEVEEEALAAIDPAALRALAAALDARLCRAATATAPAEGAVPPTAC